MAVIKSKRQENPLQVLSMALGLAVHTLIVCKNEKLFPKRDRWLLTAEIVRTALGIYIRIRKANRVRVEGMEDYTRRMTLQSEALDLIDTLMGLIDIAGAFCKLPGNKQEYWTGLALNLENKARAWHRSDQIRYAPRYCLSASAGFGPQFQELQPSVACGDAVLKPGSIQMEADGLAVDTDTLETILQEIGAALAQQCTSAASITHGPGAV